MRSNTWDVIKAVGACILVLVAVVGYMVIKVDMYGGDPACLFVHCVKVIK